MISGPVLGWVVSEVVAAVAEVAAADQQNIPNRTCQFDGDETGVRSRPGARAQLATFEGRSCKLGATNDECLPC